MSVHSRHCVLLVLLCLAASPCQAITRTDVLRTVAQYVVVDDWIDPTNMYPQGCPCYQPTYHQHEHVDGYGYHVMAYSFGNKDTPAEYRNNLLSGKGAGNYEDLYWRYGRSGPMLANMQDTVNALITGVDCSGLVTRSVGYSTVDCSNIGCSRILSDRTVTKTVALSQMKPADIFARGDHTIMLVNRPAPNLMDVVAAQGASPGTLQPDGGVIETDGTLSTSYGASGYSPVASIRVADDPWSSVAWFGARPGESGAVLEWETLTEDQTEAFTLWSAASADGPFEQISGEIPPAGTATSGAVYTFHDLRGPAGSDVFYRLLERDTSGATLVRARSVLHPTGAPQ